MVIWDNYPSENTCVMGVFSTNAKAFEYINNLEEKAEQTLFEVRAVPYLLDEEYHLDFIKEWIE